MSIKCKSSEDIVNLLRDSDYGRRKLSALKARCKKVGLREDQATSFYYSAPGIARPINGNRWDAHWFVAKHDSGALLARDGRVYSGYQEAMECIPGYRACVLYNNPV